MAKLTSKPRFMTLLCHQHHDFYLEWYHSYRTVVPTTWFGTVVMLFTLGLVALRCYVPNNGCEDSEPCQWTGLFYAMWTRNVA